MNIGLARTFLEILEAGNLNKAAERLHVTQSTVTMRINALEDLLGQKLLVRSKSGVALTNSGFKFKRYAEMLVQVWHQAKREVALPKEFAGTFNIGFAYDLWAGAVEDWLPWLRRELPQIALSLWAAATTTSRCRRPSPQPAGRNHRGGGGPRPVGSNPGAAGASASEADSNDRCIGCPLMTLSGHS
jgi:DNA-binding transcriptional LysR family regulator